MPYVGVGVRNQAVRAFGGGGAITRESPLSAIVPSCVFDLDATLAASYDGTSQLWKNLVPAPADGSAQTAYDFFLGDSASPSTDDPTFNGTAGSPAAYFSNDGGDKFRIAGGNTSFLKNLHKTTGGVDYTIIVTWQTPAVGLIHALCNIVSGSANITMHQWTSSLTRMQYVQGGASGALAAQNHTGGTANADNFMTWRRSGSDIIMGANAAAGTSYSPALVASSVDASDDYEIMRGGSGFSAAGTRIYSIAMFNASLTNDEVAAIAAQLAIRHERTYF